MRYVYIKIRFASNFIAVNSHKTCVIKMLDSVGMNGEIDITATEPVVTTKKKIGSLKLKFSIDFFFFQFKNLFIGKIGIDSMNEFVIFGISSKIHFNDLCFGKKIHFKTNSDEKNESFH